MNRQEMFDKAVEFFRTATQQSGIVTEVGLECMYEDPAGNRCVIGYMLPEAHPAIADRYFGNVGHLIQQYPDLAWLLNTDTISVAEHLQEIHDEESNWDESGFTGWDRIQWLAESFGLSYLDEPITEPTQVSG